MLHPWEVAVVDSPLFQRLRFIRQLGVGHLLFPSSGYSRFEHSLGALEAASVIYDAVCGRGKGPLPYNDAQREARRNIVRLAALLHDIGHCVFSHVSEKFYSAGKEMEAVRTSLSRFYRQKNITAAEALSILIITSEPFQQLIRSSKIHRTEFDEEETLAKACCCIAGAQDRLWPDLFMADIVNGPIDCDKMDYLRRDAHMIGVPISLDVDRLVSKLRLVPLRKAARDSEGYTLAIVPSGARALEELLVSRIFLYDKFYYHPKVMAAEAVVRRALASLVDAYPSFGEPSTLLAYGDDEFLSLTPATLKARHGKPAKADSVAIACGWLARARDRDLPRRAFAFARRFIPEAPDHFSRFVQNGKQKTISRGQEEYKNLDKSLHVQETCDLYASIIGDTARQIGADTEVFVGFQDSKKAAGKMDLPVVLPGGTVDFHPDFLFNVSRWSSAYALNKQTSFVFAYESLAKVHLAAEKVFADRQLLFAPKAWVYSKIAREDIDTVRDDLTSRLTAGDEKLESSWIAHRLSPDFLLTEQSQERIDRLGSTFSSFHHALHPKLGRDLIESWVWQFESADLQDSALCLLEHVHFVERAHVVHQFELLMERHPEIKDAVWLPLRPVAGSAKSADQIKIDLRRLDVRVDHFGHVTSEDIRSAGRVVFFDDLLNTGVQAECLLESWLGDRTNCENESDADSEGPLEESIQDALRSVDVAFCFYGAHPKGRARLRESSLRVRLQATVLPGIDTNSPAYTLDGLRCDNEVSRSALLDSLRAKGERLLTEKYEGKPKWTGELIRQYALGYGQLNLTVISRHSVSTGTPVALWQHSTDVLSPWLPVFPRSEREVIARLGLDDPRSEVRDDDTE